MKQDRFLVALQTGEWENCKLFKDDIDPEVFHFVKSFYDRTGQVPEVSLIKERFPDLPVPTQTPFQFYKEEREKELYVERATPILERFNAQSQTDFSDALLQLRASLQELERPKDLSAHSLKSTLQQRATYRNVCSSNIKTGTDI